MSEIHENKKTSQNQDNEEYEGKEMDPLKLRLLLLSMMDGEMLKTALLSLAKLKSKETK